MKIGRLLCCVAFFLSYNISIAQLNDTFEKGTIILNNGDKTEGYIKTEDLSKLSSEICFKLALTDLKCVSYTASQIKSFYTENGKIFDLLTLLINNNSNEINVFANLILKGKASLYKSVYESEEFFIIANNNTLYVLQNDQLVLWETEKRKYNYRGYLNIATEGFTNTDKNIEFNENKFIEIISGYNASKGFESEKVTYKEKNITYINANAGGGFKTHATEFYFQGMYRTYYPKISRSTSLNIGLSYFNYWHSEPYGRGTIEYTQTLTSIPLQLQQNLLNKDFRPYLFAGFNLSYMKIVENENNTSTDNGLIKKIGVGLLYGGGMEFDIYKSLMLKCEYRNEIFRHLLLFGIGYNFLIKN